MDYRLWNDEYPAAVAGGFSVVDVDTGAASADRADPDDPDDPADPAVLVSSAESFSCALPGSLRAGCRVLCDIEHPYTAQGSVLAQSQCQVLVGDPVLTFWSYLAVRCTADAFPTAALVMVDTALVVATRERGGGERKADLGRQMAVGLLGTALAAPLAGYFSPYPSADPASSGWPPYGVPILAFTACMIVAATILMCSA